MRDVKEKVTFQGVNAASYCLNYAGCKVPFIPLLRNQKKSIALTMRDVKNCNSHGANAHIFCIALTMRDVKNCNSHGANAHIFCIALTMRDVKSFSRFFSVAPDLVLP